jgi:peptide/nickel transport system substrate-binding protein
MAKSVSLSGIRRSVIRRLLPALLVLVAGAFSLAQNTERITISVGQGPAGFDPQNNNSSLASGIYINLFEYLIFKDADGNFQPALATSWEAIDENTWRVTLREGVLWHDGEPFTAKDVKFTFERVARDPLLVRHSYYSHISEVEIINDHEVIFHTSRPDPIFPSNLSRNGASVIPQHYYEAVGTEQASRAPIGTGAYRFVEYRTDDRLVLEAFDDYWNGRPAFDQAVFRVIPESSTAVSELLTGGVDIAVSVRQTELSRFNDQSSASIKSVTGNGVQLVNFNNSADEPTGDVRVRTAVDYALDNELLSEIMLDGYGVPVRGRVSPQTTGSPLELYGDYLYDPERSRELLAEAGYVPGELTLILMGSAGYADMADLVGAMLNEVGINTDIQLFEPSVWTTKTSTFPHISFGGASDSSFDYGNSLVDLTCDGVYSGRTRWCNEEFTEIVQRANAEFDAEVRAGLLREATQILLEEIPMTYLYNTASFHGVSNAVDYTPRADSLIVLSETKPAE